MDPQVLKLEEDPLGHLVTVYSQEQAWRGCASPEPPGGQWSSAPVPVYSRLFQPRLLPHVKFPKRNLLRNFSYKGVQ